ncbi:MAG TPA: hypothetical protein VIL61_05505, partial [Nitrospiria bacterium]
MDTPQGQGKGFGLFAKVIVFVLLPTNLIIGLISYVYIQDIRAAFDREKLAEARSVVSAIQERLPYSDVLKNPAKAVQTMNEIVQIVPDYLKISIYAEHQGKIKVFASTEPG